MSASSPRRSGIARLPFAWLSAAVMLAIVGCLATVAGPAQAQDVQAKCDFCRWEAAHLTLKRREAAAALAAQNQAQDKLLAAIKDLNAALEFVETIKKAQASVAGTPGLPVDQAGLQEAQSRMKEALDAMNAADAVMKRARQAAEAASAQEAQAAKDLADCEAKHCTGTGPGGPTAGPGGPVRPQVEPAAGEAKCERCSEAAKRLKVTQRITAAARARLAEAEANLRLAKANQQEARDRFNAINDMSEVQRTSMGMAKDVVGQTYGALGRAGAKTAEAEAELKAAQENLDIAVAQEKKAAQDLDYCNDRCGFLVPLAGPRTSLASVQVGGRGGGVIGAGRDSPVDILGGAERIHPGGGLIAALDVHYQMPDSAFGIGGSALYAGISEGPLGAFGSRQRAALIDGRLFFDYDASALLGFAPQGTTYQRLAGGMTIPRLAGGLAIVDFTQTSTGAAGGRHESQFTGFGPFVGVDVITPLAQGLPGDAVLFLSGSLSAGPLFGSIAESSNFGVAGNQSNVVWNANATIGLGFVLPNGLMISAEGFMRYYSGIADGTLNSAVIVNNVNRLLYGVQARVLFSF